MKIWILPIAFLGAVAVSGCEKTTVTPPSNTAVVPVPGPTGAAGPQGTPGKSGDTIVVVPPASPPKN